MVACKVDWLFQGYPKKLQGLNFTEVLSLLKVIESTGPKIGTLVIAVQIPAG
jgi:hypothetical protein